MWHAWKDSIFSFQTVIAVALVFSLAVSLLQASWIREQRQIVEQLASRAEDAITCEEARIELDRRLTSCHDSFDSLDGACLRHIAALEEPSVAAE